MRVTTQASMRKTNILMSKKLNEDLPKNIGDIKPTALESNRKQQKIKPVELSNN